MSTPFRSKSMTYRSLPVASQNDFQNEHCPAKTVLRCGRARESVFFRVPGILKAVISGRRSESRSEGAFARMAAACVHPNDARHVSARR